MPSLNIEHLGTTTIVRCSNHFTVDTYDLLVEIFAKIITRPELKRLMLVFSPQTELDATGIGILVQLHALLVGGGKRLYLCMPPPQVKDLLKERNLDSFLRILSKEEDLLVRLPEQQDSVL